MCTATCMICKVTENPCKTLCIEGLQVSNEVYLFLYEVTVKFSSAENKNWNWSQGNREHKYTGLQLIYTSNNHFFSTERDQDGVTELFAIALDPGMMTIFRMDKIPLPRRFGRILCSSHQLPGKNFSFQTVIWKTRLHSRGKWLLPFSTDATCHFHWWQELQGVSEEMMQHTAKNLAFTIMPRYWKHNQ